ncbi:hypothetical protein BT93_L1902 [Corymbia citriodora subsp. variegata]|uniref:Uncharacterized protein n=1 Tax=Corymbia citriodora subsp. variegata TaxID=360336 RepID=A0A8T0CRF7_CORYI|nr:hypothetical protein BT93_L1902 [Corymbia citriodora subsp. variegata]
MKRRRLPVPFLSPPADPFDSKAKKRPCCSLLDREDIDYTLRGFNKIALPSPAASLRHTTSGPVALENVNEVFGAPNGKNRGSFGADNTGFASPEKLVFGVNPATVTTPSPARGSSSSSLLPKPPLQRTASELASYQTSGSISSFSRGSSSSGSHGSAEESPNSKRLKTTKLCLKEMRRWWDHAMREACEDNEPDEHGNTDTTEIVHQGKREEAEEEENHEAVSVGVIHDCLSLDFNCPCGKGYQIVLSGNKCYYKLV